MEDNDSFDPATESDRKRGYPDREGPTETKKSGVRTSLDPDPMPVDEEDDTEEQISTLAESTVDPSGKSPYHFMFLIACG